jgi:hypothetical protein
MKRDMDLVRKILFEAEKQESGYAPSKLEIEPYTEEQIRYHAYIMKEAGLVEAVDASSWDTRSPQAIITRLTWQGHEFLDAARDEGIWEKAKSTIKKVGGATLQIWIAVLTDMLRKKVGL